MASGGSCTMKNQEPRDITCKKIAWTIRNFSKLTANRLISEAFTVGDVAWEVIIYPKGKNVNYLSLFLGVADTPSLPEGWSIYAEYSLAVVNQLSNERKMKGLKHQFHANEINWGFSSFIPLSTLHNRNNGYILNDECIIEVDFSVVRSKGIKPTSHAAYPSLSKESEEVPSIPNDKPVDFKDFGQIEKVYIPLLEEACLSHPSLVECQKERTRRAFTALGQVLLFLKTKKWKDMNEDACIEHLQQLWEELKTFRFDLSWLETHVQSALSVKAYMEKAEQIKMLRENLVPSETEMKKLKEYLFALETEMEKLREKLVNTEENVEKVRKDLVEAEEGFEEKDLNSEIGYEKP